MNSIGSDLKNLESRDPNVKYGPVKKLLKTGAEKPELLYDHFDGWIALLDNPNSILKWMAIDIIGYLSDIDSRKKVDRYIPKLRKLLRTGQFVTSAHAIFALGLIAQNKPEQRSRIIRDLVTIRDIPFETEECRNIATGKAIEAMEHVTEDVRKSKAAMAFVRQATANSRTGTQRKAERLLKQLRVRNPQRPRL